VPDELRKNDEQYRSLIDGNIKHLLDKYKIKYTTLTGSVEERLSTIYNLLKIK
jgi:hypothetical protein